MSSHGAPRAAPLDQDALGRLRRTMGSEAEFRDMLNEFLGASSRLLRDMEAAMAAGKWHDAERAAHTLKSMARMVGAFDLAESCAAAEVTAARSPLPAAAVEDIATRLGLAQGAVHECLA